MNTRTNKTILLIILMICLATAVYSAVGTFTFRTSGASDTTEVVDLRYPQKVPEDSSVTTDSIEDGSITNDKLAEPVSVANGGTGKTTAAEALAALGGASLNGSSTVAFNASTINGVAPLTAAEKTQALVGSTTVGFLASTVTAGVVLSKYVANAGLAASGAINTNYVIGDSTTVLVSAGTTYAGDSAYAPYLALVCRAGTSIVVVELSDAGNCYTITADGSYNLILTNNTGGILYGAATVMRIR